MLEWIPVREQPEGDMDHSPQPTGDSTFPAMFVVLSTFIGGLVWLCVMLGSLPN